ncbi:ribosomal protein L17 [Melanogaster broomeanus]|nr:ribosomal protein L17 [Melanogaster broomeanus]
MKHGVAFRKFSRTSSHRNLMLRNLVTSLFEHEQIRTTLPKAKDAARLAEKIITLGKKGNEPAYRRAQGFLLKPAERPGGYTRVIQIDNRVGDNAPMALLELVDNPNDFKLEMTARAVGRELMTEKLRLNTPRGVLNSSVSDAHSSVSNELRLQVADKGQLRPMTRMNLQKVMKYRGSATLTEIGNKATAYIELLLAKPVQQGRAQMAENARAKSAQSSYSAKFPKTSPRAGAAVPGEVRPAVQLATGRLRSAKRAPPKPSPYNAENLQLP